MSSSSSTVTVTSSSTSSPSSSSGSHGNFGAIGPPNRRSSLPVSPHMNNHYGGCGFIVGVVIYIFFFPSDSNDFNIRKFSYGKWYSSSLTGFNNRFVSYSRYTHGSTSGRVTGRGPRVLPYGAERLQLAANDERAHPTSSTSSSSPAASTSPTRAPAESLVRSS